MNLLRNIILPIISVSLVASCQKVIKIDLNSTDPKYVIEANVADTIGGYIVKLSKTVNFDQSNVFPAVSGAVVTIKDGTTGITDTLHESAQGYYRAPLAVGIPGHAYQLYISVNGRTFTATSVMPQKVVMDSLYRNMGIFDTVTAVSYYDPAPMGNYYYFAEYKNGIQTDNIFISNDEFRNGQQIARNLTRGGGDNDPGPGDLLTIDLQCIDSAMYQYYFSLQQTKNQDAATPANPVSNITGGALGYFSAHTSSKRSIIIP